MFSSTSFQRLRRTLFTVAILCAAQQVHAQASTTVAAASDMKFALEELARNYERTGGGKLRLVFGASGNLAQQIRQGAPFDLFLSADERYVELLHNDGFTLDEGRLYAMGHVVLFVPNGSPLRADGTLEDLRRALEDGRLKKLAIANPEHAPYGRAARSVLEAAGIWEKIREKLVLGENVSQAAQFAASGSAQAGLIALSLAVSPNFANAGAYVILPAARHTPLRQRMVRTRRADENARRFYAYLQQPSARALLKEYGFALPGD